MTAKEYLKTKKLTVGSLVQVGNEVWYIERSNGFRLTGLVCDADNKPIYNNTPGRSVDTQNIEVIILEVAENFYQETLL